MNHVAVICYLITQLCNQLYFNKKNFKKGQLRDFPGDSVVKSPPANARDMGSIPDLGKSHMPRSN